MSLGQVGGEGVERYKEVSISVFSPSSIRTGCRIVYRDVLNPSSVRTGNVVHRDVFLFSSLSSVSFLLFSPVLPSGVVGS